MGVGFAVDRIMAVVDDETNAAVEEDYWGAVARDASTLFRTGVALVEIEASTVVLTRKQRGEMAEAAFVVKMTGLGFAVAKPWGESSRYDLIVDSGRKLLRVQVKSAHRAGEYEGYTFHAHGNSCAAYRASEIDLLVAYVVPEDVWYVFPVAEFRRYRAMKVFPSSKRRKSKFEKFREAWWLVR
jgi:hypothetical protein